MKCRWNKQHDFNPIGLGEIVQLGQPLFCHSQQYSWIVDVRAVIGDAAGQTAEIWHEQNEHILTNETLIRQPIAPVRKEVRAGGRLVELGFSDRQGEVECAHLSMRKRLAQGKSGCKLVGRQGKYDHTRARSLFEKATQAKVPVQVVRLFDGEPADGLLRGQIVPQTVELNTFEQSSRREARCDGRLE